MRLAKMLTKEEAIEVINEAAMFFDEYSIDHEKGTHEHFIGDNLNMLLSEVRTCLEEEVAGYNVWGLDKEDYCKHEYYMESWEAAKEVEERIRLRD